MSLNVKIGLTALVLLAFAGGVYYFQNSEQVTKNEKRLGLAEADETILVVPPQISSTTVTIERIVLNNPGYVTIRSAESGRLGQIIEISPYLLPGEHINLSIDLGEFYDGESELVVVLYQDNKNDMVFNDLDQLMLDTDGKAIARYVKTGEAVQPTLFANTGESMPHSMGNTKMETVRYTNTGYEPPLLEIPLGTMVQFINESDDEMWVASNEHPAHTDLPTFDQFGLSPKGSTYIYTFDEAGAWAYHDHINPEREGTVQVI